MEKQENSGYLLSADEMAGLRLKLQKSHLNEKDWDYIYGLFAERYVLTLMPTQKLMEAQFSFKGVLRDKDNLIVFTDPKECAAFGEKHPVVTAGGSLEMGVIPFSTVRHIAEDFSLNAYIDPKNELNSRFLVYDGKTKTFHVYIIQNLRL